MVRSVNLNSGLKYQPQCGATAKSTREQCRQPAMSNKRVCRLHGGKSTGPKTRGGKERLALARTKHGRYSAEVKQMRKLLATGKRQLKHLEMLLHAPHPACETQVPEGNPKVLMAYAMEGIRQIQAIAYRISTAYSPPTDFDLFPKPKHGDYYDLPAARTKLSVEAGHLMLKAYEIQVRLLKWLRVF